MFNNIHMYHGARIACELRCCAYGILTERERRQGVWSRPLSNDPRFVSDPFSVHARLQAPRKVVSRAQLW